MTQTARHPRRGDFVDVTGHRVGEPARSGKILDVLGEEGHRHYRVRWQDGHESIVYPGSDTIVRHARRTR